MYISECSGAKKTQNSSAQICSGQMSHRSYSYQLGNCIWSIYQDNCTGLNARLLRWGDQVTQLYRRQQYAGMVCVHSPEREWKVTANRYRIVLSDRLYPVMKQIYPDGSGPSEDDNIPILRTRGVTESNLSNSCESYELWEVPDQRV